MKKHPLVPKYFRTDKSVKTIDIIGKKWFDKVNGNTYNSVQVTVNHGLNNEFCFSIPFQYGYGDYYQQSALEKLQKMGVISDRFRVWDMEYRKKFVINSMVYDKCLKREVVAWGKELQTL